MQHSERHFYFSGGDKNPACNFLSHPSVKAVIAAKPIPQFWLVNLFLKGINQGGLSASDFVSLSTSVMFDGHVDPFIVKPEQLTMYRCVLAQIVAAPSIAQRLMLELHQALAGRVVTIPTLAGTELTNRVIAADPLAGLDHALLLLACNYSNELCQCGLSTCGMFFLAEPVSKGRPQRKYCSDAHRDERFASESADRVRKSRANSKRKSKRNSSGVCQKGRRESAAAP